MAPDDQLSTATPHLSRPATTEWDAPSYDRVSDPPDPTYFTSAGELEEWLVTVVLGAHLDRRPMAERRPLVQAVTAGLPALAVDYVRLNIVAARSHG